MLRRSTRKRVPTAASIGQGASARKKVMRSSPPAVTSSSVSPVVMSTLPDVGFPELLYSRVPQQPSTSTVGVTGQMPLMSTLPQRIPVTQQIPVITAGLAVPQPSTGLDLQCDAGNMHVNELPFETCKASDDITRNVAQNIKHKIMLGEYVDLSSLLCNTLTNGGRQTISVFQGQLSIQPKQPETKIVSIEMWTDSFLIFISIYCSAHPSLFQDLLKYMKSVRLGSKRCVGLGWKAYDEQFRLRMAQDPTSSWAAIDTELWLLLMQPVGNVQHGAAVAPRVIQNYGTVLKCYAFNYNGLCT